MYQLTVLEVEEMMYIREYNDSLSIPIEIIEKYRMKEIAYFDIETTGFDKDKDRIILISLGVFLEDGSFNIKQYYAESLDDEIDILFEFGKDLSSFSRWCSYNGIAFDEPFVIRRMEKNSIVFKSPSEHIDLYRLIRPYYKQLGMERCNLKTVEKYLGVQREDKIDGGMCVELYYRFLDSKDEELKHIIMLHNYEDVLNLPKIFKIVYQVERNNNIVREDCITEKQLGFLKSLISKNKIVLKSEIEKISKKSASRVIDAILKGNLDGEVLDEIISNSY
jgi:uncharacterized protein YprB with RNaseH-like and TPR domain